MSALSARDEATVRAHAWSVNVIIFRSGRGREATVTDAKALNYDAGGYAALSGRKSGYSENGCILEA